MNHAYFVTSEPLPGHRRLVRSFDDLTKAQKAFTTTHPEFEGGSVLLFKVESPLPGVTARELRTNALRKASEYDSPQIQKKWIDLYDQNTTILAADKWVNTIEYGEIHFRHAGKRYMPSFGIELVQEMAKDFCLEYAAPDLVPGRDYRVADDIAKMEGGLTAIVKMEGGLKINVSGDHPELLR
jgi:hypothetical protein